MGGKIRRIGVDRFPAFDQAKLLEAEIAVDSRLGWRCARLNRNRVAGVTDRPLGYRSARWLFACPATLPPAGWWSVCGWRRKSRASDLWDLGTLPSRIDPPIACPTFLRSRLCRDSCAAVNYPDPDSRRYRVRRGRRRDHPLGSSPVLDPVAAAGRLDRVLLPVRTPSSTRWS